MQANHLTPRPARRFHPAPAFARLAHDRRGSVTLLVAAGSALLAATVLVAIDLTNFRVVKYRLQSAADAAALAGVSGLDKPSVSVDITNTAKANVPASYGNITSKVDITYGLYSEADGFIPSSSMMGANAVKVRAVRAVSRGNAVPWLTFNLFGFGNVELKAEAIAARQDNIHHTGVADIRFSPNMRDYTELYAYCASMLVTGHFSRDDMTLIASNADPGTDMEAISNGFVTLPDPEVVWPKCNERGQTLSFRLRSIRGGKNAGAYTTGTPYPMYDFYTDTVIRDGAELYFGLDANVVESIICNTANECDPTHPDTIIPKGNDRTVHRTEHPCLPGKYLYYGWEDRKVDFEYSDRNYSDVQVTMACPTTGPLGAGFTRLVR